MSKKTTIEEVLKEWIEISEHKADLTPLIEYYGIKYKGTKIIDYAIEGDSIFLTPENGEETLKIKFRVDNLKP